MGGQVPVCTCCDDHIGGTSEVTSNQYASALELDELFDEHQSHRSSGQGRRTRPNLENLKKMSSEEASASIRHLKMELQRLESENSKIQADKAGLEKVSVAGSLPPVVDPYVDLQQQLCYMKEFSQSWKAENDALRQPCDNLTSQESRELHMRLASLQLAHRQLLQEQRLLHASRPGSCSASGRCTPTSQSGLLTPSKGPFHPSSSFKLENGGIPVAQQQLHALLRENETLREKVRTLAHTQ